MFVSVHVHVHTHALASKGIDAALSLIQSLSSWRVYHFVDSSTEESQCQEKEKGLLIEVRVRKKLCHYNYSVVISGALGRGCSGIPLTSRQAPSGTQ